MDSYEDSLIKLRKEDLCWCKTHHKIDNIGLNIAKKLSNMVCAMWDHYWQSFLGDHRLTFYEGVTYCSNSPQVPSRIPLRFPNLRSSQFTVLFLVPYMVSVDSASCFSYPFCCCSVSYRLVLLHHYFYNAYFFIFPLSLVRSSLHLASCLVSDSRSI